jgi:hypothetical protein
MLGIRTHITVFVYSTNGFIRFAGFGRNSQGQHKAQGYQRTPG